MEQNIKLGRIKLKIDIHYIKNKVTTAIVTYIKLNIKVKLTFLDKSIIKSQSKTPLTAIDGVFVLKSTFHLLHF